MEPIWPPAEDTILQPGVVPMFPLRGVFLFPGQILPLHIFEPRYVQMIEDLLDGPGRLVMGTILEDQDGDDDIPAVLPTAGLGEIARHERLPDGRFGILLFGLSRVHITEIPVDRPYRMVRCEVVRENQPSDDEAYRLMSPLVEAIQLRTGQEIENAEEISTAQLTDILAQTLTVPQSLMEEIFSESEVGMRAEKVLEAHQGYPASESDED